MKCLLLSGKRENPKFDRNSEVSELSGNILIRKIRQNQGKQKNVQDSEEFELNGSRDIEVQLHLIC